MDTAWAPRNEAETTMESFYSAERASGNNRAHIQGRGSRDCSGLATGGKFLWIPEVLESLDPPDLGTHNGTASPSKPTLTTLHRQSWTSGSKIIGFHGHRSSGIEYWHFLAYVLPHWKAIQDRAWRFSALGCRRSQTRTCKGLAPQRLEFEICSAHLYVIGQRLNAKELWHWQNMVLRWH